MPKKIFSFRAVLLVLLTATVLILGGVNVYQKRHWVVAEDGTSWIQASKGVVRARLVQEGGPADRAGIREGDILRAIDGHAIQKDWEVTQILYGKAMWSSPTYTLERGGATFSASPVVTPPPERVQWVRLYLEIIGLLYFLVGSFVLLKRSRGSYALHFYLVCLTSFVLYVFHYTGEFSRTDWAIFWGDLAASILLAPMFLQFCLDFPFGSPDGGRPRRGLLLLYVPGAMLLAVWLGFIYGLLDFVSSPLAFRTRLENLTDFHLAVSLAAGAVLLLRTYRRVHVPELRQQMKWVTLGTAVAVLPYFLFQSLPRMAGIVPGNLADLTVFPLALIPIFFGYAIHRYRLMDVDILFKRGVAYTLATASAVGLYATVAVLVGELLGPDSAVARIGATILAAVLFAPIKDRFQKWLDRFFYRDRYDVRETLIDFGRTLGSEVHLETMLERIADRLGRALLVDRTAVFLEDTGIGGERRERFYPVLTSGVTIPPSTDLAFLDVSPAGTHICRETDVCGLRYFIPCRVKNRVIAYIGLGRTRNGDELTSEDLGLLETVSDYIGIALENARLYRSLEREASEYQNLKEFSENIIESISVGVIVEDDQGRIAGWNKALENLTGKSRGETFGKRTSDVIPASFVQRLDDRHHLYKQRWNNLTVNLSATSLVDKSGANRGRLIIINNITDRIRLEDQLIQNEKLTSIGLLAAGVAHEVNTPLAVISSYSQMLRKAMSPEDSRVKLLEKITKQTFRASEIVNSLLSFSRTSPTEFAEVDMHHVIGDTLSLLDHQLKAARIRVRLQFDAECPLAFGNSGRLQQVFLNLILNARDAMADGGELRIRTRSADAKIEIVVEDTGTGISSEHINKIYDPFFTTKMAGKGTGLGLSVSYGIVQDHGGNIAVESRPAKPGATPDSHAGNADGDDAGTTFKLEFPLARKPVNV